MTIEGLGDFFLYGGMVGITVFTLDYGLRSRWWKHLEGIAIMARSVSMTLVSALVGIVLVWGRFAGIEYVRLAVYLFFFASCWFGVVVLMRRQHRDTVERDRLLAEYAEARQREGDVGRQS